MAHTKSARKARNNALWTALFNNDTEQAQALIAQGANVNARIDTPEVPILSLAVRRATPEAVRVLLTRGADTTARDGWGRTPLMLAVCRDDENLEWTRTICQMLLEHGADPHASDAQSNTVLTYATDLTSQPDFVTVQMITVHNLSTTK